MPVGNTQPPVTVVVTATPSPNISEESEEAESTGVAPVPAETVPPDTGANEAADGDEGDDAVDNSEAFLQAIIGWNGDRPSDDDLLAMGQLACDQLSAGAGIDDTVAVPGIDDAAAINNQILVGAAAAQMCPE